MVQIWYYEQRQTEEDIFMRKDCFSIITQGHKIISRSVTGTCRPA